MFATVVLAALSAAPADPPVLADLHAFPIPREVALLNRDATLRHKTKVADLFDGEASGAWCCRQDQVWYAWAFLADALDERAATPTRLKNLSNLKGRIGPDAYYAGRMPSPIPDYGGFRPWQK